MTRARTRAVLMSDNSIEWTDATSAAELDHRSVMEQARRDEVQRFIHQAHDPRPRAAVFSGAVARLHAGTMLPGSVLPPRATGITRSSVVAAGRSRGAAEVTEGDQCVCSS